MLELGFKATTDSAVLDRTWAVVICVPTPLTDEGGPDLQAVIGATKTITAHLHRGMLVVLESTTYPGTTEEILQPILEKRGLRAGKDFHLAFSPERIDPGNKHFGVANTPKIVGGVTPECTTRAEQLYSRFIDKIVRARSCREAETAKLLENTYRHVNIALVNEMARFCHELDIDIWNVIDCAESKPFGFQAFRPGPGVGGHCIPIDPNYLSFKVKASLGYQFRFVELAQEINASMPNYVLHRVQDLLNDDGRPLKGSRVLLLGVTYKPNLADDRETPAREIAALLSARGADVSYHDPYALEFFVAGSRLKSEADLDEALTAADIAILLQPHNCYDLDEIATKPRRILDTRGVLPEPGVRL